MTIALARPLRSGLAVPAVVALVAVATFIGLGSWQLQRKAWKEAFIESLEQRLSASPGDLPTRERWARLAPASDEFRRVKFSAAFVPGAEALVYTSGSALAVEIIYAPPYWVHALLWGPLILITTLLPLRPVKGLLIALQYHHKAAEGRFTGGEAP